MTREDGLLLLLFWMRTGITMAVAAPLFGVHPDTARRTRDEHLLYLYYVLRKLCPFPSPQQFVDAYPDWLARAAGDPKKRMRLIPDCFGQRAQRPTELPTGADVGMDRGFTCEEALAAHEIGVQRPVACLPRPELVCPRPARTH